jgi:cell division protein FtsN
MAKSKVFENRTVKEIQQAERFKARLENAGLSVTVTPCGLDRVRITGKEGQK